MEDVTCQAINCFRDAEYKVGRVPLTELMRIYCCEEHLPMAVRYCGGISKCVVFSLADRHILGHATIQQFINSDPAEKWVTDY